MPGRAGRVHHQRREVLDPPIPRDVIYFYPAFPEDLFHAAIRQAEPQVSAHRQHDHLRRGPVASERRPVQLDWTAGSTRLIQTFSPRDQRNRTLADGVKALSEMLAKAGYGSIVEAVAAHALFLHPDTVAQTSGRGRTPVWAGVR